MSASLAFRPLTTGAHRRAPQGAPNVPFALYDDGGLASWSPFGRQDKHTA